MGDLNGWLPVQMNGLSGIIRAAELPEEFSAAANATWLRCGFVGLIFITVFEAPASLVQLQSSNPTK